MMDTKDKQLVENPDLLNRLQEYLPEKASIQQIDEQRGATTVEYVIIASIVAALALAGGAVLKPKMSAAFTSVGARLDSGAKFN